MSEKKKWETKPNTGSAFVNKRKLKDTHPDFTGEILVTEPGLYWFSMWEKRTQSGEPWYSVGLNPKEDRSAAQASVPAQQNTRDEDTPF